MTPNITIVVPSFNERNSLEDHLPAWLRYCEDNDWIIIVVDDGSTDDTEGLLRSYLEHQCLEVYQHKMNRGYGSALKTGLAEVSTAHVITMDADGQHVIEDAEALIEYMKRTDSDMVIGSRKGLSERNLYRRIGKAIIRRITRLLFATTIYDLNSGFKAYKTEYIKAILPMSPDSMAFSDIVTLLHLHMGLRVTEYPVQVQRRGSGRSTITTMTAFQTVMEILNVVMWFSPSRIFLPIASALLLLGLAWAIPFLIRGRGLSTTALLFILSGITGFMLALLAEQLAWIRKLELPSIDSERMTSSDKSAQDPENGS